VPDNQLRGICLLRAGSHQKAAGEAGAWGPPGMAWEGVLQRGPLVGEASQEAALAEQCHLLLRCSSHYPAGNSLQPST